MRRCRVTQVAPDVELRIAGAFCLPPGDDFAQPPPLPPGNRFLYVRGSLCVFPCGVCGVPEQRIDLHSKHSAIWCDYNSAAASRDIIQACLRIIQNLKPGLISCLPVRSGMRNLLWLIAVAVSGASSGEHADSFAGSRMKCTRSRIAGAVRTAVLKTRPIPVNHLRKTGVG